MIPSAECIASLLMLDLPVTVEFAAYGGRMAPQDTDGVWFAGPGDPVEGRALQWGAKRIPGVQRSTRRRTTSRRICGWGVRPGATCGCVHRGEEKGRRGCDQDPQPRREVYIHPLIFIPLYFTREEEIHHLHTHPCCAPLLTQCRSDSKCRRGATAGTHSTHRVPRCRRPASRRCTAFQRATRSAGTTPLQ